MKTKIALFFVIIALIAKGDTTIIGNAAETSAEVVHVQEVEPIEVNAPPPTIQVKTMDKYRYIEDCPLSKELQRGIFDICEKYKVSFELVMAVIEKESNYNIYAVGDNCNSVGLMQIQEKWHKELMQELGVHDLYNPLENVEVGVALLAEYYKGGNEVYYVLMKYNGGAEYANRMIENGTISEYAIEITETAIIYAEQNGI